MNTFQPQNFEMNANKTKTMKHKLGSSSSRGSEGCDGEERATYLDRNMAKALHYSSKTHDFHRTRLALS